MYLSRDLNLFLLLWKKLKPEAKFEVVRTLAITFIFNIFELLNIFLASSFAYVITGNNLNNSEKLGFITKFLSLNELDFIGQLKIIGILFAASSLGFSIFSIFSLRARVLASAKVSITFTENILFNFFNTKFKFFSGYKKEKIINTIITEASLISTSVLRPLLDQINSIMIVIFLISFWLYYDFRSALLVIFAGYLLYSIVLKIFSSKLKSFGKKVILKSEEITKNLYSLSNLYKEYLMSNLINRKVIQLLNNNRKFRIADARNAYLKVSGSLLVQGLIISCTILYIVINQEGSITSNQLATLGGLLYTIQRSVPLLQKILRASNTINSGYPAFESFQSKNKLFKENKEKFTHKIKNRNNTLVNDNELITLEKVEIPNSKLQKKKFSHTFKKYGCTGLVGQSGLGKTSILNIISGLDNELGGVYFRGENLKNLEAKKLIEWRKNISFVSQKPHLIFGSLEENIVNFSNNVIDHSLLNKIIEMPWMKDIIETLNYKKSSEKIINEGGSNLSGGQIQRIAIARALYQDNPILILDEVTSALDKDNEEMVMDTLEKEKFSKCIILVTHRISPLRICDDIINLDDLYEK